MALDDKLRVKNESCFSHCVLKQFELERAKKLVSHGYLKFVPRMLYQVKVNIHLAQAFLLSVKSSILFTIHATYSLPFLFS